MTIDRRVVAGLMVASATAFTKPLLALADSGPPPPDVPGPETFDASAFVPYVGLAVLILVAILAVRSPGSRRPIAAVFVAIVTTLAVLVATILPGFSCFDCSEGPDQTPWTILAIVIAIVGVVLMIMIIRGGASSGPASDARSNGNE